MSFGRQEFPELGELLVATVVRIEGHGAYVTLDEYGDKEGLLHISEISSSWVRNIRNHVREGQKVVLQVLRVDPSREHIDLSLRRVSRDERRKKMEDWKKTRKAETLLKSVSDSYKMSDEDFYKKVTARIIDHYGNLYSGLEAAAKMGVEALKEAKVPVRIAKKLTKIAEDKIAVKGVTIHGLFEITSMDAKGVEEIKEILLRTKKLASEMNTQAELYSHGAPKYRIEVTADDYKQAEAALEEIVKQTTDAWAKHDGKISFDRE